MSQPDPPQDPSRDQPPEPGQGIRCPACASRWVPVQRTVRQLAHRVLRYRKCRHCGRTFCTTERLVGE